MQFDPFTSKEKLQDKIEARQSFGNIIHKVVGSGNHKNQSGNSGRKLGSKNLSLEVKALIGTLAKIDGTGKTAKAFNMHDSNVSLMKHGKVVSGGKVKSIKELEEKIDERVSYARELVKEKIVGLIENMTEDKIEALDIDKASKVANNLVNVYDKLDPRKNNEKNGSAGGMANVMVFFGVKEKEEKDYESIEVGVAG